MVDKEAIYHTKIITFGCDVVFFFRLGEKQLLDANFLLSPLLQLGQHVFLTEQVRCYVPLPIP